jgi:hypothetical protein
MIAAAVAWAHHRNFVKPGSNVAGQYYQVSSVVLGEKN